MKMCSEPTCIYVVLSVTVWSLARCILCIPNYKQDAVEWAVHVGIDHWRPKLKMVPTADHFLSLLSVMRLPLERPILSQDADLKAGHNLPVLQAVWLGAFRSGPSQLGQTSALVIFFVILLLSVNLIWEYAQIVKADSEVLSFPAMIGTYINYTIRLGSLLL